MCINYKLICAFTSLYTAFAGHNKIHHYCELCKRDFSNFEPKKKENQFCYATLRLFLIVISNKHTVYTINLLQTPNETIKNHRQSRVFLCVCAFNAGWAVCQLIIIKISNAQRIQNDSARLRTYITSCVYCYTISENIFICRPKQQHQHIKSWKLGTWMQFTTNEIESSHKIYGIVC